MISLPQAIAKWEGFGASPFNRPTRLHNPGDIEWEPWNAAPPYNATLERTQPDVRARFAQFPTNDLGWQALKDLLSSAEYRNLTITQLVNKYAPGFENDVADYIKFICRQCECLPTDTVAKVMGA